MVNSSAVEMLRQGLVISCQAPAGSPMHAPNVIAAMAQAAINQGAIAVRIDSPAHVQAVRQQVSAPIIGLWKQQIPGFDVYITPQFHHAAAIAQAGADIIAIDATLRPRPDGETVESLIQKIHAKLGKPVMADVDTLEAGIAAAAAGADLIGTTLYGYTPATHQQSPPGFDLLIQLVEQLTVPVICEGGIASPQMARQAIDLGASVVVVGTAITGVDLQVKAYLDALRTVIDSGELLQSADPYRFTLLEAESQALRSYIETKLSEYGLGFPEAEFFFAARSGAKQVPLQGNREAPLNILLLNSQKTVVGGLVGFTRWNWLHVRLLWVDKLLRRQGYGKRLMQFAEDTAKQRGCQYARLSTLSFQAQDFYLKLGYQVTGQVEDYPPGHTQYLLRKTLQ